MKFRKGLAQKNWRMLFVSAALLASIGTTATILAIALRLGGGADSGTRVPTTATLPESSDSSCTKGELELPTNRTEEMSPAARDEVARRIHSMPSVFVQNDGQWDGPAKFVSRAHGVTAAFEDQRILLGLHGVDEKGGDFGVGLALQFAGASEACAPCGEQKLAGVHHYLHGQDPSRWHVNVPLFEAISYKSVYPGISIVVHEQQGMLEYDLHVQPGADLGQVRIDCEGADHVSLDEDGTLALSTSAGTLRQAAPKAWSVTPDGGQKIVQCNFRLLSSKSYGLQVRDAEPGCELVVDPGLDWSTYFGNAFSTGDDAIAGCANLGTKLTVVGSTTSPTLPFTTGVYQIAYGGGIKDAFVARFDSAVGGTGQLLWSTFFGGSDDDDGRGLALSADGSVSICGSTLSTDFPVVNAYQSSFPGGSPPNPVYQAGFVSRLSATGSTLYYSSYFGKATGQTIANAIAIDSTPVITIVGSTAAWDLPLTSNAYDTGLDGYDDAFVAQFGPTASGSASLVYSSYIGGSAGSLDEAWSVALESTFIYIGGETESPGFHTKGFGTGAAFQTSLGGFSDGFLMVLDPHVAPANQLKYATFLGGSTDEVVRGLVVKLGVMSACGWTSSTDFPMSTAVGRYSSFQTTYGGGPFGGGAADAFVAQIDPASSPQLLYSTYLGGSGDDFAYSIGLGPSQTLVVVGGTSSVSHTGTSTGFPVGATAPFAPFSSSNSGGFDMFLTRLRFTDRTGSAQLDYSTYFGGGSDDWGNDVSVDSSVVYAAGWTYSPPASFPLAGSPFDSTLGPGGLRDGFACRFTLHPLPFP